MNLEKDFNYYYFINKHMEPENLEMTPEELVKHARKHPHTHTLST